MLPPTLVNRRDERIENRGYIRETGFPPTLYPTSLANHRRRIDHHTAHRSKPRESLPLQAAVPGDQQHACQEFRQILPEQPARHILQIEVIAVLHRMIASEVTQLSARAADAMIGFCRRRVTYCPVSELHAKA